MNLEQTIIQFLKERYTYPSVLLLGLSGGPDSVCLFHLLLNYAKKYPLNFAVAHVDHGWRKESATEAEQLRELAQKHDLVYHLKTLNPKDLSSGNLEDACRNERYKFFGKICREYDYRAILVAHQGDDQAETVLKRIFEGSSLINLAGIREESDKDGIPIWRPLLKIPKKEILAWLAKNQIRYFEDSTNYDSKFLRARFRESILPLLAENFGKEITFTLNSLSQDAHDLQNYLQGRFSSVLNSVEEGPFGSLLDLKGFESKEPFALKYILKQFCQKYGIIPSREAIHTAAELIIANKANCYVNVGSYDLYLDRSRCFLLKNASFSFPKPIELTLGTCSYGPWKISCSSSTNFSNNFGWREAWRGRLQASLPLGTKIGIATAQEPFPGLTNPISKWWTNEKVPAFLRSIVPVIWHNDKIVHEFLSGRTIQNTQTKELSITLEWQG